MKNPPVATRSGASASPAAFRRLAESCDRLDLGEVGTFARRVAEDLERHSATILVCGEFKRGKSSIVNALLDLPTLLPVDIRPTTAVIHVIRHGEPGLVVHARSGASEALPLSALGQLTSNETGGSRNPEDIEFAEITLPSGRLEAGLVLVDTPGTNDLCQTRAEVVYRMIPRADAVLFVLDATTQLTRTEIGFLTDRMLKSLAPPLCFVLNKMDRLDEDEREEVLEATAAALTEHLPGVDVQLVPASTRDPAIGVKGLTAFLAGFLAGGERHAASERKRVRMFETLRGLVLDAIAQRESLGAMQAGELKTTLDEARRQRATLDTRMAGFQAYLLANGTEQLVPMIQRSFVHHLDDLERLLIMQARAGGNPSTYAENQLPYAIETGFKQWLDRKLPEIGQFTTRYQQAMLHEYHRSFGDEAVRALRVEHTAMGTISSRVTDTVLGVDNPEDGVGILMRTGLPAAGALIALTAFTGGAALLVGGAVGGLVGQVLSKQRIEVARETLVSQLPGVLRAHGDAFINQVTAEVERFLAQFARGLAALAEDEAARHEQRLCEAIVQAERHEADRLRQQAAWATLRNEVASLTC
jgi:signal recognition particle receptor subunit beta